MRFGLSISIAILFLGVYSGIQLASDPTLVLPVQVGANRTANVGLTLSGTPSAYQIQVRTSQSQTRTIVSVHVERFDKQPFKMGSFSVTTEVPRSTIQGIWYPSATPRSDDIMTSDVNHPIDGLADADFGIPYVAAAATDMANVFALGLGSQDLPVSITGRPLVGNYQFQLTVLAERTATSFDESFYISTDRSLDWFDTAADYADWVDESLGYEPFPVASRAYEPLYDVWYWAKDRVDDRLYLETARLAAEAGFGTYLADSGWDTATGEYDKWLNGRTGDYDPVRAQFSDLATTFDRMRSENHLGISLWLQPFAVGRASKRYPQSRDMHIHVPSTARTSVLGWLGLLFPPFALPSGSDLETVNLCPRTAATQEYLKSLFAEVAEKYRPEAYWIDFIDGVSTTCTASHAHTDASFGAGLKRTLQGIKDVILANNAEAVVQFRAKYANLHTKSFANVWQTEDSPGDYDAMRLNSIRLRPFSRGVVFAADQMYWPDSAPEATVAKFIATSVMIGVPAFGPNLVSSPPSTMEMLRSWLAFYREHRQQLTEGRFSLFGQLKVPNQKIEGGDATFAYVRNLDFPELVAEGTSIYLVNATNSDQLTARIRVSGERYAVQVFDRYLGLEMDGYFVRPLDGVLDIDLAVQQGGMLMLTPADVPTEPSPEEDVPFTGNF